MTLDTSTPRQKTIGLNLVQPSSFHKNDSLNEHEDMKFQTASKESHQSNMNSIEGQAMNINESFSVLRSGGDLMAHHGLRKISSAECLDNEQFISSFSYLDHSLTQ